MIRDLFYFTGWRHRLDSGFRARPDHWIRGRRPFASRPSAEWLRQGSGLKNIIVDLSHLQKELEGVCSLFLFKIWLPDLVVTLPSLWDRVLRRRIQTSSFPTYNPISCYKEHLSSLMKLWLKVVALKGIRIFVHWHRWVHINLCVQIFSFFK